MSDRMQTPDVIGQATAAPEPDRQQASKTTRRDGVNKAAKKTREVKPSAPDTDKLKATFYLESAAARRPRAVLAEAPETGR